MKLLKNFIWMRVQFSKNPKWSRIKQFYYMQDLLLFIISAIQTTLKKSGKKMRKDAQI